MRYWQIRGATAAAVLAVAMLSLALSASPQLQAPLPVCRETAAPILTVQDGNLAVNGQPRFVVLASYFDAMRASPAALERDFALLKQKGVGGVRIFPLWINLSHTPQSQKPEATVLDENGRVRSAERWNHLATVLSTAAACGLIVDMSFNREMLFNVGEFTVAEYHGDPRATICGGGAGGTGLAEIACRLKGARGAHVMFDLQNERDQQIPGMHLTDPEVKRVRDAVKQVDPSRIVMVSQGPNDQALAVARSANLDVVAIHEPQESGAYARTAASVAAMKVLRRPVYVQEGQRATLPGERERGIACAIATPGEANPFFAGLLAARGAGAAAWTFHTDAGFSLDTQSFEKELAACPREIDFLNRLSETLR